MTLPAGPLVAMLGVLGAAPVLRGQAGTRQALYAAQRTVLERRARERRERALASPPLRARPQPPPPAAPRAPAAPPNPDSRASLSALPPPLAGGSGAVSAGTPGAPPAFERAAPPLWAGAPARSAGEPGPREPAPAAAIPAPTSGTPAVDPGWHVVRPRAEAGQAAGGPAPSAAPLPPPAGQVLGCAVLPGMPVMPVTAR